MEKTKPKVAFICVHNACRSQIAEAFGKQLAHDVFDSFSAGTQIGPEINPEAAWIMKEKHGLDMLATQQPKLLSELPPVDMVVTMGCDVECPQLPCKHREDWRIADPTGLADEVFLETISAIEMKILDLKQRIKAGEISF